MISKPGINCSHCWVLAYTECCHDVICASIANVQRHNVIFVLFCFFFDIYGILIAAESLLTN